MAYESHVARVVRAVAEYNRKFDVEVVNISEIIDKEKYCKEFPSDGSVSDFGVWKALVNPKIDNLLPILKKREEKNIPLIVSRVKWNDEKSTCTLVGDYRVLCYMPEQDWIEIMPVSPANSQGSKCKISSNVINAFEQLLELLELYSLFQKKQMDLKEKTCQR